MTGLAYIKKFTNSFGPTELNLGSDNYKNLPETYNKLQHDNSSKNQADFCMKSPLKNQTGFSMKSPLKNMQILV